MMGTAARQRGSRATQVHLVVCTVFSWLCVAQALRSLQQGSCVVLGSTLLRNCNNQNCYCEGKYPSGNLCKCKGECDPTYKICDGNANNQANCDCSRLQSTASVPPAAPPSVPSPPVQKPTTPAPPKQSPPATPAKQTEPVEAKAAGPAQHDTTSTSSPGSNNAANRALPLGLNLANLPVVG